MFEPHSQTTPARPPQVFSLSKWDVKGAFCVINGSKRCSCVTFSVVTEGCVNSNAEETSVSVLVILFCPFHRSLILSGRCYFFMWVLMVHILKGKKMWNLLYNRLSFIKIAADSQSGIESVARIQLFYVSLLNMWA